MTVKFLGGHNATGGLQTYDNSTATVAPTVSTAQHRSGPYSVLLSSGAGNADSWAYKAAIVPKPSGRISIGYYMPAYFTGVANIAYFESNAGVDVDVDTSGHVVLKGTSGTLGTSTGTVPTNGWFTVGLAFTITTATNWTIKVYINGTLDMTLTNANGTLWTGSTGDLYIGSPSGGWGASKNVYFEDVFIDDDSGLSIPGDIRVTNKKPAASAIAGFDDTKTAAQRVTAVSQRPLLTATAATDRIIHAGTTDVAETFEIERRAVGDADLTNAKILGYVGWIWKAVSSTTGTAAWDIIVNEITTALPDATSTAYALATQIVTTSVYPETLNAIGMRSTTIAADTLFGEAGILVAYYPASPDPNATGESLQSKSTKGVATTSVAATFDNNVAAGSLLVVAVDSWDTTGWADGNVTDNKGQTYTRVGSVSGTNVKGAVYYCANAAAGATTITANNGNTSDKDIAIHEYSGMAASSVLDQFATSVNNAASTTYACGTTAATSNAYDLVFYMAASEGNTNITVPPANSNKREEIYTTANMPIVTADKFVSATGAQTGSFTGGQSFASVGMVVVFKQGGGGDVSTTINALTETESTFSPSVQGSASTTASALSESETQFGVSAAIGIAPTINRATDTESAFAPSAVGAASVPISLASLVESVLAVGVRGDAVAAINRVAASETAQPVTAVGAASVSTAQQSGSESTFAPTARGDALASLVRAALAETANGVSAGAATQVLINALSEAESVNSVTTRTDIAPAAAALNLAESTSAPTVQTGASTTINRAAEVESAQPVSVVGSASTAINALSEAETLFGVSVSAAGGISVSLGALSETETQFAATARGDASTAIARLTESETQNALSARGDALAQIARAAGVETIYSLAVVAGGQGVLVRLSESEQIASVLVQFGSVIAISFLSVSEQLRSALAVGDATIGVAALSEVETGFPLDVHITSPADWNPGLERVTHIAGLTLVLARRGSVTTIYRIASLAQFSTRTTPTLGTRTRTTDPIS